MFRALASPLRRAGRACRAGAALAPLLAPACGHSEAPAGAADPAGVPRLARREGVDPLVLERLDAALAACAAGTSGAELELALLYHANGLVELALATYRMVLAAGPAPARVHYFAAQALEAQGRPEEARLELEQVRALAPDYAPGHWRAGDVLLELGRRDEAAAAFRAALALEPASVAARLGLARVALLADEPRAALEALAPVVEREPRERFAHGLLARAWRALGDEARAADELAREERANRTTVIDPWTAELQARATGILAAAERANELLTSGEARAARELLLPLYERFPEEPAVQQLLAKAELELGACDAALEVLERARASDPDQFKLELLTGQALARKGANKRALTHLERARELNPAFAPTLAALGECQLQLGQAAAAEETLTRALAAGSDAQRTQLVLGQAAMAQGTPEALARARATFQAAAENFPGAAAPWAFLAEAQARAGERAAAERSLAEAERRDPKNERLELVRALLADSTAESVRGEAR